MSKKVYISHDVFEAFIDRAHPRHLHAGAFFRYFAQEHFFIYTNIVSVQQTHQFLHQAVSQSIARDFLKALALGNINILYPDDADLKAVVKVMTSYNSSELSFTDALMSVCAERAGIGTICTFDYLHPLFGLQTFFLPI